MTTQPTIGSSYIGLERLGHCFHRDIAVNNNGNVIGNGYRWWVERRLGA
jgi:hypothetical protein